MEDQLLEKFNAFCSFGSNRAVTASEIDNFKFSKLCKECNIIDKKVTTTDVDIIFNRAKKSKTDRKLDFEQFKVALKMLAEIKFTQEDGYLRICQLVNSSGPKLQRDPNGSGKLSKSSKSLDKLDGNGNVKASADSVFDRLTDHTKYTGSHKERFDEEGKGKGKEGRVYGDVHHIGEILRK